ncbi:MAG: tRNA (adenosine(37)-N6)-dimethylallyltransferase MiaA [Bifidobacteriaceae bacterium]|jgi:tRNA dimethylallyltransferase|nr:tRNA (adenosine(37)-N6)-dimethylallyltransferase MiaA [Bifidobacteriaceae bacterium]
MPKLISVVGPTATGKSELALALAQRFNGEIVSADAMQLYRGMDIGTAKLPLDQRRGITHHQIDVLEPFEEAAVAAYQKQARQDIENIWQRGRVALLVGGSGLYVRAVLDNIVFPGVDLALRAKIEQRAEVIGNAALHAELAQRDPAAAAQINPANRRRMVRALEVIEATGQPFTASLPQPVYWQPAVQIGLDGTGEWLDERINRRAHQMIADGLVAETSSLLDHGLRAGRTASRAIGYREALAVIDGLLDLTAATEAIALATRQLARRQRKWFRRDQRITWLNSQNDDLEAAAASLVSGS